MDNVILRIFEEMVIYILLIFVIIFRELNDIGEVLNIWKIVFVCLIYKGKKFEVINYCLVLLICIVCKLMEYVVINSIRYYVD